MSGELQMDGRKKPVPALLSVVMLCSLVVLALFVAVGWWAYDQVVARSILAGGILANGSFYFLKRDAEQIIARVSVAGSAFRGVKNMEKVRFFVKFYARLFVIGLLLFALTTKAHVNLVGVAVGLSTVMLSVIVVVLGRGRIFFGQRMKGV